jgi:hypothetical protein
LASSGRLEEAIPVLKKALLTVDADANYMPDKLRALMVKTETVKEVPKRELTARRKRSHGGRSNQIQTANT